MSHPLDREVMNTLAPFFCAISEMHLPIPLLPPKITISLLRRFSKGMSSGKVDFLIETIYLQYKYPEGM